MIVYRKPYQEFHIDIQYNRIEDEVVSRLPFKVGKSERISFRRSLPTVDRVLEICKIPDDIDVALEYRIPLTNKRVDFMIAGSDENGQNHLIICELKQWESVEHTDMPDIVRVGKIDHVHPSWQAYSYGATISHFNEYVDESGLKIHTCTFLHDYDSAYINELKHPIYSEGIEKAPPFISNQFEDFSKYISHYIKKPPKGNLFVELDNGKIRPSKMLADCLADLLNRNEEYNLIDRQRIVYSNLYREIKQALHRSSSRKQVFIVRGGAGTGKSVIAMQLMANININRGHIAHYVAKSSYVKEAYYRKLTKGVPEYEYLRSLFLGSGSFYIDKNKEKQEKLKNYDVLLVDEAHRLTERTKKSWMYYGENQIREIISACKVAVFFIDETQNVDIKDYGTVDNIIAMAREVDDKAIIHCDTKYILDSQFRCNGSDDYVAWLESVLYNKQFKSSGEKVDYDLRIYDDLCKMRDAIKEKNANSKQSSRMLSGDVFEWKSMKRENRDAIDIEIGDFKAQWNKTKSFATDPRSIDEVGCIHTSQGMEFEYVGLIVGDDILYRDGKVITDFTKHPETAGEFRRPHQKKVLPEDYEHVDRIIRNTYKVLFTRGQRGCFLYIMDPELREYMEMAIIELTGKSCVY